MGGTRWAQDKEAMDMIASRNARRCRHFNGLANKRCRAGVKYKDLIGTVDPRLVDGMIIPCIGQFSSRSVYHCRYRLTIDREETRRSLMAAEREYTEDRLNNVNDEGASDD
jgi:hypothetical protein